MGLSTDAGLVGRVFATPGELVQHSSRNAKTSILTGTRMLAPETIVNPMQHQVWPVKRASMAYLEVLFGRAQKVCSFRVM